MSILIGLAREPVFNAAMATQVVFQRPVSASIIAHIGELTEMLSVRSNRL